MEKENFYEIGKEDFKKFVDTMIEEETKTVVGAKSKGDKFVYDTLDSADELRLDYDVTVLPPIMYKFVIKSLKEAGMDDDHIILSLERRMKCGVGKCGHCQINGIYVCQDGPVFNYADIKDLPEAL